MYSQKAASSITPTSLQIRFFGSVGGNAVTIILNSTVIISYAFQSPIVFILVKYRSSFFLPKKTLHSLHESYMRETTFIIRQDGIISSPDVKHSHFIKDVRLLHQKVNCYPKKVSDLIHIRFKK